MAADLLRRLDGYELLDEVLGLFFDEILGGDGLSLIMVERFGKADLGALGTG